MIAMTSERARLAEQLAAFSRTLYQRFWMPGTAGNLSVRLPGPEPLALITASGKDKGDLTAAEIVTVDIETGLPIGPTTLRASAETAIHTAIYRATGAEAVIHVHPPYATAVARRTGPGPLSLERFELLKGWGLPDPDNAEVPVFINWPLVDAIADEVGAYLAAEPEAPPALLIADHGATVWGADLAQARNRMECLEAICQLLLLDPCPPRAPSERRR